MDIKLLKVFDNGIKLLNEDDKKEIRNEFKVFIIGFLGIIGLVCILSFMSGFTLGSEIQEVRAMNTIIYSFQKVKMYDLRFRMPAEVNTSAMELDVNPGPEVNNALRSKDNFSKLLNSVDKKTRSGVLELDYSNESIIPESAYDISLDKPIIERPNLSS